MVLRVAVFRPANRISAPAVAVGLAFFTWTASAHAQRASANAHACSLMPTAAIEAHYGGKGSATGTDGPTLSICSLTIGGHVVKIQAAQPGAASRLPTSIAQGLEEAKKMFGGGIELVEAKDLGKVGCFTVKSSATTPRRKTQKPIFATTCFVTDGGYLNIGLADHDPQRVTFDTVRPFLDQAVAKRK